MSFPSFFRKPFCLVIVSTIFYAVPVTPSDAHLFQDIINASHSLENIKKAILEKIPSDTTLPAKHTTVLVYIAGCNDLLPFIERNLMQLMQVGTNNTINLLVHLNTIEQGRRKITKRLIVYKNKLVQVGEDPAMDSGSPETLIHACTWAFTHFPSEVKVVILWNHGTGGIEPEYRRAVNPSELYVYNPSTQLIELNRSIGFLDYIQSRSYPSNRGICFDDITRHYLTNRQVGQALRKVSETVLGGEPFDLVCCDACLMADIAFAYSLKFYNQAPVAKFLVASQEVVLATGYPYTRLFSKPAYTPLAPIELAKHIVEAFGQTYHAITQDYTHSAVSLFHLDPLYEQINKLALLLIEGMKYESNRSVRTFIKKCSSKELCTHFEEPTYKDLHHLCTLMLQYMHLIQLANYPNTTTWFLEFKTTLQQICSLIKEVVIRNSNGNNLAKASGLSIYLPFETIHPSYAKTDFGSETTWLKMLQMYVHGA